MIDTANATFVGLRIINETMDVLYVEFMETWIRNTFQPLPKAFEFELFNVSRGTWRRHLFIPSITIAHHFHPSYALHPLPPPLCHSS